MRARTKREMKAPREKIVQGFVRCFRLAAGLGLLGLRSRGRAGGAGGEYFDLFAAFQKLLFPKPIESCLVTNISRHGSCFL